MRTCGVCDSAVNDAWHDIECIAFVSVDKCISRSTDDWIMNSGIVFKFIYNFGISSRARLSIELWAP